MPIKMCSDCETCELLNHCNKKMKKRLPGRLVCSDCEAYGLKKHGLPRSDCIWYTCTPGAVIHVYILYIYHCCHGKQTVMSHISHSMCQLLVSCIHGHGAACIMYPRNVHTICDMILHDSSQHVYSHIPPCPADSTGEVCAWEKDRFLPLRG